MPSFIFHSNTNEASADLLIRNGAECIVPKDFEGVRGEVESRNSNLRWHLGAHTPFELYQSTGHGFAVLIGDAINADSNDYLSAQTLFNMVAQHKSHAATTLSKFSGFFAWIVVLEDESVHIGSDPFGFFPIYYFQSKHSLSIATSLKALHKDPEYNRSIDPVGFCRYLLENGCSGAHTLEKSGERLNIAESIHYSPTTHTIDTIQHKFPGEQAVKRIHNFEEAIELSTDAISKAVKRHTKDGVDTCLLSGGLDSRHVLSVAHKLDYRPHCVTVGDRDSYECINARKVARRLQLPWQCTGSFYESSQNLLEDEINLYSLGGGFNGLSQSWGHIKALQNTRCLTGLYLDVTYAPFRKAEANTVAGSYEDSKDRCIHNFGILPDSLNGLLKTKPLTESLETALSTVRREWNQFPEDPNERHWHTIARFRARSHVARLAWKNAFYFQSIIPALDVPLTESIRCIDGGFMQARKLQNETFIAIRPDLATIPFASMEGRPKPLIQTRRSKYATKLQKFERRLYRFNKKYLKSNKQPGNTSIACWHIAKQYALKNIDAAADIYDIDKVKKIIDGFQKGDRASRSINRELYSQRLLIGSICWLANQ